MVLNGLCSRTAHYCSSSAIVNRWHFHSCGPVVSTSVAQLTKMCRLVGCRPVGLSPTCLSPRWFVAQMTGDPTYSTTFGENIIPQPDTVSKVESYVELCNEYRITINCLRVCYYYRTGTTDTTANFGLQIPHTNKRTINQSTHICNAP